MRVMYNDLTMEYSYFRSLFVQIRYECERVYSASNFYCLLADGQQSSQCSDMPRTVMEIGLKL